MAKEFCERLRLAIGDRPVADVAEAAGVAPNTLRTYLSGAIPKLTVGFSLARVLAVCPEWLAEGTGPMRPAGEEFCGMGGPGRVNISYLPLEYFSSRQLGWHESRSKLVDGFGVSFNWAISELNANDLRQLWILYIDGDSMSPHLRNGNLIFVSGVKSESDIAEGVYVMRFSDMLVVRRLMFSLEGNFLIRPDNPAYGEYEVEKSLCSYGDGSNGSMVTILGRVIYVGHKI